MSNTAVQEILIAAGGEPRTDDEIGAFVVHGVEQVDDLRGIVLFVGVALHHHVVAVCHGVAETAAQRTADTEVDREPQHDRAFLLRDLGGAVDRAVVGDERRVAERADPSNHPPDRPLLVERRDHDQHLAGSSPGQAGAALGHCSTVDMKPPMVPTLSAFSGQSRHA